MLLFLEVSDTFSQLQLCTTNEHFWKYMFLEITSLQVNILLVND